MTFCERLRSCSEPQPVARADALQYASVRAPASNVEHHWELLMNIIGSVGYAALIVLAATWVLGVRLKLEVGIPTVLGALFFVAGAVWLTATDTSNLHSLWIIPAGFVLTLVSAVLAAHVPPLFLPLRFLANLFASIIRVGIPSHRIRAAREADLKASIGRWASKHRNDER